METLGQRVRRLRKERGWSQEELAERGGPALDQTGVSKIENGTNKEPSVFTVAIIAGSLGVTVDDLLGGVAAAQRSTKRTGQPRSEALERSVRAIKALETAGIDRRTLMPQGPDAAGATPRSTQPFRDPWPSIEALQKTLGEVQVELKALRAPAAPPRKRKPSRRRTG